MTEFAVEQDDRGVVLTAFNEDDSIDVFTMDSEAAFALGTALIEESK